MNSCKARVVSIAILNFRAGVALRHSSTSTRSASGLVSWVRHNITSIYPLGPPSGLAPLSDTVMIKVLSNWPVCLRKAISSPMW